MESTENWLPIPGYKGYYEASSLGRVRSIRRQIADGRVLSGKVLSSPVSSTSGYRVVSLSRNGKVTPRSVHSLVCCAFHGLPGDGRVCRHLNGDRMDNRSENLAWGTPRENWDDAVAHGTASQLVNGVPKLTWEKVAQIRELIASGVAKRAIADSFGVDASLIYAIESGKIWREQ